MDDDQYPASARRRARADRGRRPRRAGVDRRGVPGEGAQTLLASDGNKAVDLCRDDPPDLVVLDMMLPGRSGFLALERIKGREDSPLVIMVTANEGKRHQAYAESLGVDGYLLKPVPLEKLLDAAVALIDARDAEEED
ncbi:MAG TPA: response regulator [Phycisphaerales bacterium]|nr:response regulator [Phycisphaerales bacterium]